MDEFNTTNLFSIVPTVIDDKLNLSLSNAVVAENSKLMIFDSSGKEVFNKQILNPVLKIAVDNLGAGMYYVKIISNNLQQIQKFIKK